MTVSTHVLDTSSGRPAAGVHIALSYLDPSGGPDGEWVALGGGETDADGRHRFEQPGPVHAGRGVYRLEFLTGRYFGGLGVETFYPQVTITFGVTDSAAHYHVPLLLSPFGYSTYRGS